MTAVNNLQAICKNVFTNTTIKMADKYPDRGKRLDLFFKSLNIKRKEFADKINIKYGVLLQIVNGHVTLTPNLADRVVQAYPDLSTAWLLHGIGAMLNENTQAAIVEETQEHRRRIALDDLADLIRNLQDQVAANEYEIALLKEWFSKLPKETKI